MAYAKPWISYLEQLQLLKDRGLHVSDEPKALEYLERIGYYRLSGYWYPFRVRSGVCCPFESPDGRKRKKGATERIVLDEFKPGASFQKAVALYVFDKRLRLLVLDALERIEVALRVDISHTLGRHDPFAYLKPELLHETFAVNLDKRTGLTEHHRWLENHARGINRSREGFIQHNKHKYELPLPLWIACEVWDFGTMSTLFGGMREADQDAIANKYGIDNGRVFASWLRSLNYLRNVCAHHSRLWNRNMDVQPKKPKEVEVPWFFSAWEQPHIQARPFLLFCIIQHFMRVINPNSTWWLRLTDQLNDFPDLAILGLDLQGMGAIAGWQDWDW